jgi:hypothetical protein
MFYQTMISDEFGLISLFPSGLSEKTAKEKALETVESRYAGNADVGLSVLDVKAAICVYLGTDQGSFRLKEHVLDNSLEWPALMIVISGTEDKPEVFSYRDVRSFDDAKEILGNFRWSSNLQAQICHEIIKQKFSYGFPLESVAPSLTKQAPTMASH